MASRSFAFLIFPGVLGDAEKACSGKERGRSLKFILKRLRVDGTVEPNMTKITFWPRSSGSSSNPYLGIYTIE
jgi:hypothetical protein